MAVGRLKTKHLVATFGLFCWVLFGQVKAETPQAHLKFQCTSTSGNYNLSQEFQILIGPSPLVQGAPAITLIQENTIRYFGALLESKQEGYKSESPAFDLKHERETELAKTWLSKADKNAYHVYRLSLLRNKNSRSSEASYVAKASTDSIGHCRLVETAALSFQEIISLYGLWKEGSAFNPVNEYALKHCEAPAHQRVVLGLQPDNSLKSECMPEVLYSWGSERKLERLISNMGQGGWRPMERPLFLAQGPLDSYGYGPISIRVKLKKNVKFQFFDFRNKAVRRLDTCQLVKDSSSTIAVTYYESLKDGFAAADYIICSNDVIESWSYGTQEHFNEMLRQLKYMQENPRENYDLWLKAWHRYSPRDDRLVKTLYPWVNFIDDMNWSPATLFAHIQHMFLKVGLGGNVYASPSLPNASNEHFNRERSTYFSR